MYIQTIPFSPLSNSGLDSIPLPFPDDGNYSVEFPLDFDINFLNISYTSVFVGTNSFLTFGGGSSTNNTTIPSEIPSNIGLPGVYLSTYSSNGNCCLDSRINTLYSGVTDGGNTVIIRIEGNDDYDTYTDNLVYNFKFYKDQSDYFDLIIEKNEFFCNNDSTGGLSDGVNPDWLSSFDSSGERAYRIYNGDAPNVNQPRSANTETLICYTCNSDINNGVAVFYFGTQPHPVWSDGYGTPVTQMNMVLLGGNGLNG